VAAALEDRPGAAAIAGAKTLERRALIDAGDGDDEVGFVEPAADSAH